MINYVLLILALPLSYIHPLEEEDEDSGTPKCRVANRCLG
jgi:hypothetical protein